tara:strand:- start:455 stop:874 length:420 start_codon:yes stop_codon:yes gene_type:complete
MNKIKEHKPIIIEIVSRDNSTAKPIKHKIQNKSNAVEIEIEPLAKGLVAVLFTDASNLRSKISLTMHPADLITMEPIAKIMNTGKSVINSVDVLVAARIPQKHGNINNRKPIGWFIRNKVIYFCKIDQKINNRIIYNYL